MQWSSQVVAYLRECKDAGVDFETAWTQAITRFPPRGPGMGQHQMTLEEDGEPSIVQFTERVCRDAWYDRGPRFTRDLMDVA